MSKVIHFTCIDGNTAGNPVRIVTNPILKLKGNTMMKKRLHFLEEFDWIRKGLMFEPRGHDMMSGSFSLNQLMFQTMSRFYLLKPAVVCLCAVMD